jgi:predicted acyltransferase
MATGVLPRPAATMPRLVSLDAFRGLTMAGMVIVNNPGDWAHVYWPLLHADWHGWTPTDLIFPFFLFIVGASIALSSKTASVGAIVRRAAIIFALGLFLAGFPRFDLARWRIPGVLQRIAVCYLVTALVTRRLMPRISSRDHWTEHSRSVPGITLVTVAIGLTLVYWFLMTFVPAPGGVAGDLTPDGNLGAWIDRTLIGGHLLKPRWDPEGLLSTIPAISTTMLGAWAGLWIRDRASGVRGQGSGIGTVGGLLVAGAVGIALGYLWNIMFPINKNLWTSSYVLFTAGAASLILAFLTWVIDERRWVAWAAPFVILGSNALALFVASGLLAKTLSFIKVVGPEGIPIAAGRYAYLTFFVPLASPRNASLLYAFANLLVLFVLLSWMYHKRIFLRA